MSLPKTREGKPPEAEADGGGGPPLAYWHTGVGLSPAGPLTMASNPVLTSLSFSPVNNKQTNKFHWDIYLPSQ